MNELIFSKDYALKINDYIENFLDYIDVSKNTVKTYSVGLKSFASYLSKNNIKNPAREDIINYRECIRVNLKPTTVNSYMIAIRTFYDWLEYENITKNVAKKIKGLKLEQKHLKRGLSKDEVVKVLSYCENTRERLMLELMITCGLRCNEVVNIQLKDIYNDKGIVMMLIQGKARDGEKQDAVKIDNRVFETMKEYIKEYNIDNYLFTSTSNHNNRGKLSTMTVRRIINNLFIKAGLDREKLSPHSTRHTTCELALEMGVSLKETSEFMRHKSIQTTLIYSKEYEARNSKIANELANIIF